MYKRERERKKRKSLFTYSIKARQTKLTNGGYKTNMMGALKVHITRVLFRILFRFQSKFLVHMPCAYMRSDLWNVINWLHSGSLDTLYKSFMRSSLLYCDT